jgi:hypothetical protein
MRPFAKLPGGHRIMISNHWHHPARPADIRRVDEAASLGWNRTQYQGNITARIFVGPSTPFSSPKDPWITMHRCHDHSHGHLVKYSIYYKTNRPTLALQAWYTALMLLRQTRRLRHFGSFESDPQRLLLVRVSAVSLLVQLYCLFISLLIY